MSGYAVTAQYYDPLMSAAHGEVDRRIAAALAGLDAAGPVVDIGAGTGLSTALIAATLPGAEILAVEPDPAMRPALMTRVWGDPDLRGRVTILPFGILEAPLPERIGAALLSASLVHLGPAERARLWPLLAARLAPGGRIVVEVQCPVAQDIAEAEMRGIAVGRMTYRGTAAAERIGADRQRWRMTYRAELGGVEIAREAVSYECWTISAQQILDEGAAAGLRGRIAEDLVILGHASA
jgi:trans-aconitate methyltransferase